MQRLRVPEIMDDPSLPFEEHEKALRGVERLNMFSEAHLLYGGN